MYPIYFVKDKSSLLSNDQYDQYGACVTLISRSFWKNDITRITLHHPLTATCFALVSNTTDIRSYLISLFNLPFFHALKKFLYGR
jgi:hypothetical protein